MKNLFLLIAFLVITFNVSSAKTIHQTYKFQSPEIVSHDDGFVELKFPECFNMGEEGTPLLPYLGCEILLPQGTEAVSVKIVDIHYSGTKDNVKIVPAARQFPISRPAPPDYKPLPDMKVYGADGPYPENVISNLSTQFLAGYSIAIFNICPVEYHPSGNAFRYITSIEIEINIGESKENIVIPARQSPLTIKRLEKIVDNPEMVENYSFSETRDDMADILIITRQMFVATFDQYIQYKTSKGFMVETATTETIYSNYPGADNQEKIRNCIIDYYQNKGIQYVILGGDADAANNNDNIVPHRGFYVNTGFGTIDADIPSDLYYGCLDGNWNSNGNNHYGEPGEEDLFAEVYVGRFCIDNYSELNHMISKMIKYSETPVVNDIEKALMIGEQLDGSTWGGNYKEEIADGCSNYGFTTVGIPDYFNINRLYEMSGSWSKNDVFSQFSNFGCHLLNHLGHSANNYNMKMYNSDVTTGHFQNNGTNHGLVIGYSQGCYNGAFDNRDTQTGYGSDCFAEKITTVETAEVATIGNSRYGWYQQNSTNGASQYFDRQFFDAIFSENITQIGAVNSDSKEDNASFITSGPVMRWCAYETNLFGDPSMDIWTAQPGELTVTFPQAIPMGMNSIDVETDAPYARIGLMQDNALIGRAVADENGNATVELFQPVSSDDNIAIAVTAHNKLPFNDVITVITDQPYVVFDSYTINDENGNNNGIPEYGEEIGIGLGMTNLGNVATENVVVTLSSGDPYITLPGSGVDFGNFNAGETVFLENAFAASIADNIPDQHEISIGVEAVSGQTWTSDFNLTVNAPQIKIASFTIDDATGNGNGLPDPGETVTFKFQLVNEGHAISPGIAMSCNTANSDLTLANTSASFGPLMEGQSCTMNFVGSVNLSAPYGSIAVLETSVEYGAYEYSENFTCKIGVITEDFETGDFSRFNWEFFGTQPWEITSSVVQQGVYSIKSGTISHNQSSGIKLQVTVETEDTISFYRKISSEPGYDFLTFYIDNEIKGNWSGDEAWAKVSFPISAGEHTFKWSYHKDPGVSTGEDCAWIDFVQFPPVVVSLLFAGSDVVLCAGDIFSTTATGNYIDDILWETSGSGTFADPTQLNTDYTPSEEDINNGSVTLTVTAAGLNNNTLSDDLQITFTDVPSVPTTPTGDTEVCTNYGETYYYHINTCPNAETYIWELVPAEAGTIDGNGRNVAVTWTPDFEGTVQIHVKSANNCGESDFSESLTIEASVCSGIPETSSTALGIWPNPNNGLFTITMSHEVPFLDCSVYNSLGRLVYHNRFGRNSTFVIDLTGQPAGVYYLQANDDKNIHRQKVLIR